MHGLRLTNQFDRKGFWAHRGRNARAVIEAAAGKSNSQSKDAQPPARLSKILKLYEAKGATQEPSQVLPGEEEEDLEDLLVRRNSRRDRSMRASAGNAAVSRDPAIVEKQKLLFYNDPDTRARKARVGGLGRGQLQWWSLWVKPGREKQVCEALERLMPGLPPLQIMGQEEEESVDTRDSDEEPAPRELETWVPEKRITAWNPKTGKPGNKLVKYDDGGWVLMRAVLDNHLSELLKRNVNILGFRDIERFEGVEFPRPATEEQMEELKKWEEDLSEWSEEFVRAKLGLPEKKAPDWEDLQAQNEEAFWESESRYNNNFSSRGRGRGAGRGDSRGRGAGRTTRGGRDRNTRQQYGGGSGLYTSSSASDRYSSGGGGGGGTDQWYDGNSSVGAGWSTSGFDEDSTNTKEYSTSGGWYSGTPSDSGEAPFDSGWYTNAKSTAGRERRESSSARKSSSTGDKAQRRGGENTKSGSDSNDVGLSSWYDDAAAAYQSAAAAGTDAPSSFNTQDDIWANNNPQQSSPAAAGGEAIQDMWGSTGDALGGSDPFSGWLDDFSTTGGDFMSTNDRDTENTFTSADDYSRGRSSQDRGAGRGARGRGRGRDSYRDRDRDYDRSTLSYDRGDRDGFERRGGYKREDRGGPGGRGRGVDSYERKERGYSSYSNTERRSSTRYTDGEGGSSSNSRQDGGGALPDWWDDFGGNSTTESSKSEPSSEPSSRGRTQFREDTRSTSRTSNYDSGLDTSDNKRSYGEDYNNNPLASSSPSSSPAAAAAADLPAGSAIKVTSGPFQDFDGVILDSGSTQRGEGSGKIKAEIDVFGKATVVELNAYDVKPDAGGDA